MAIKAISIAAWPTSTKALALNPNYARGYISRAAIRLLRGDRDPANADYQTALRLDPSIAAAADVRKLRAVLALKPD
jgi:Tfp pilus assembly protein PilF